MCPIHQLSLTHMKMPYVLPTPLACLMHTARVNQTGIKTRAVWAAASLQFG